MAAPPTGNPTPLCQGRLPIDLEDISDMNQNSVRIELDPKNLQEFYVYVKVFEGLYRDKWFKFKFVIPNDWPIKEPWIRIMNKIWHPNIELLKDGQPETGRICVSTLGKHYQAGTTLYEIVVSIQFILVNPNPNDSRNPEAGSEQKSNYDGFKRRVYNYLDEMDDSD